MNSRVLSARSPQRRGVPERDRSLFSFPPVPVLHPGTRRLGKRQQRPWQSREKHGGGMEMILNCDYVVAGEDAKFALPEVKRGVIAVQGGESSLVLFHAIALPIPCHWLSYIPSERAAGRRVSFPPRLLFRFPGSPSPKLSHCTRDNGQPLVNATPSIASPLSSQLQPGV